MFSTSAKRVPNNSERKINERIRQQTESSIACFATAGREAIDRRLADLDREWDIERALEANAASFSLLGLLLGFTVHYIWLLLSLVVGVFLLQHALQGWCPPVPIMRRLGFRTRTEIDYERYALKALRGDFQNTPTVSEQDNSAEIKRLMEVVQS